MLPKTPANNRFLLMEQCCEAIGSSLTDFFPEAVVSKAGPRLIAFVGAGGKTTSILNLAVDLRNRGQSVLVMTTTHMQSFAPLSILSDEPSDILRQKNTTGLVIAGTTGGGHGMRGLSDETYAAVKASFDYIIYEADGARRHPIKTPAEYEPVLLPDTDLLFVCMGLSALGKPLGEICHRYERLLADPSLSADTLLNEELAASILLAGYDHHPFSKYYLLNQADSTELESSGRRIAGLLPVSILASYAPENRNVR